MLTFKTLHGLALSCLSSDECQLLSDTSHRLQSSATFTCCVVDQDSSGDTSFTVADPRLWNMLSASLHLVDNMHTLGICRSRVCVTEAVAHSDYMVLGVVY